MKTKYIIFDLDDTLLKSDKTVGDFTLQVLKEAKEKGHYIIFNTSRSMQNSLMYAKLIKPDFGIYNGGCQIVDINNNDLYSITISADETKNITKYLNSICEKISVQTKDSFLASDHDYKGQNAKYFDFSEGYYGESYKILCFSQNHDLIEKIALENNLEYQNYLNKGWHRLSKKGGQKWNGVLKLLELTNGSIKDTITFGDDYGDEEMILKAKCGVAMANSRSELLKTAPNITLSNNDEGVAHFIKDKLL